MADDQDYTYNGIFASDDIVTLLREGRGQGCTCAAYNWGECGCSGAVWAEAYINDAADEIERLRDELAAWQGTVRAHEYLAAKADDEIKQLREAGNKQVADDPDDIVQELHDWQHIIDGVQGQAVVMMLSGAVFGDAADEIERLRATGDALVEALDGSRSEIQHAADAWQEARRDD